MEFYFNSPSETFVVLTTDQFVERDDGLLEQQRQGSHVCRRNRTFPLMLRRIRVVTTKATKSKKLTLVRKLIYRT